MGSIPIRAAMNNLTDYLKQNYKLPLYTGYNTLEEFCDINNIDIDNINEFQIKYYCKNLYSKFRHRSYEGYLLYIEESLKSHTKENIIKGLNKILPEDYKVFELNKSNNEPGIIKIIAPIINDLVAKFSLRTCTLKSSKLSDDVYDLIDFYVYNITYVELDTINKKYIIYLEPTYTKNVTDEVKKNGNIVYHITHKNNLEKILRSGLRPRVGKTPYEDPEKGYRYFPDRLFVVNNSKNIKKDLTNILRDKGYKEGEYVILKINLKHHNISFFIDDASDNKNDLYTLEYIPPILITQYYNINDIN